MEYFINEKLVWQELNAANKKNNESKLKSIDRLQRVENVVADGVPDVNGCIMGYEFWIEIKCPKIPKRKNTPLFGSSHKIRPNQFAWFKAQTLAEGLAFLLISCSNAPQHILLDATRINANIHLLSLGEILEHPALVSYAKDCKLRECWGAFRESIIEVGSEKKYSAV